MNVVLRTLIFMSDDDNLYRLLHYQNFVLPMLYFEVIYIIFLECFLLYVNDMALTFKSARCFASRLCALSAPACRRSLVPSCLCRWADVNTIEKQEPILTFNWQSERNDGSPRTKNGRKLRLSNTILLASNHKPPYRSSWTLQIIVGLGLRGTGIRVVTHSIRSRWRGHNAIHSTTAARLV